MSDHPSQIRTKIEDRETRSVRGLPVLFFVDPCYSPTKHDVVFLHSKHMLNRISQRDSMTSCQSDYSLWSTSGSRSICSMEQRLRRRDQQTSGKLANREYSLLTESVGRLFACHWNAFPALASSTDTSSSEIHLSLPVELWDSTRTFSSIWS